MWVAVEYAGHRTHAPLSAARGSLRAEPCIRAHDRFDARGIKMWNGHLTLGVFLGLRTAGRATKTRPMHTSPIAGCRSFEWQ